MKPFRFRLAKLERLRELAETETRAAYAAAQGEVTRLEDQLAALEDRRAGLDAELLLGRQATYIDPGAELAAERTRRALATRAENLTKQLALARSAAERARATWSEARREQRSLERLEERQREQWAADNARAEQTESDERTSARFQAPGPG